MKSVSLLILCAIACATSLAQVPVNRSMSMVQKSTASWCGPCGGAGWILQEDLITDNMAGSTPPAIVLETHGTFSAFRSGTSDSMIQGWMGSAIPKWAVNNNPQASERFAIKKVVDSIAALNPTASAGFYYTLTGNTIKFYTKTQFWKAASGVYSIGAYIVEDSVFGEQVGQPGNNGWHRYILRDHIGKNVFGDTIATGSIAANQTFSKSYTYNVTRTDWNKAKFRYMTVVWKRNGTAWNSWEVVNVNSIKSTFLEVGNIAAVDQLLVYPNPASDHIRISGALNIAADAQISIVNALGQAVYQKAVTHNGGQLSEDIRVGHLPNGIYTLLIRSEGALTVQKLLVRR